MLDRILYYLVYISIDILIIFLFLVCIFFDEICVDLTVREFKNDFRLDRALMSPPYKMSEKI